MLINSLSAVFRAVLSVGIFFWVQQRMLTGLLSTEYAGYAVVQNLTLFLGLLSIVLGSGVARFVIERRAKGDELGVTQVTSTVVPLCIGAALATSLIGAVLVWNADKLLPDPAYAFDVQVMLGILVASTAIRLVAMPFSVGLEVQQKNVWIDVIGLIGLILFSAGLLALFLGVGDRAMWMVVATVPQTLFVVGTTLVLSLRLVPELRFRWGEFRSELVRPILSFGGWTVVARFAALLRESGPLMLTYLPADRPKLERADEVAAYNAGAFVERRVFPVALLPLGTTLPALTAMYATGQEARLQNAFFRMARYVMWCYLFFAIPLILYHAEFAAWFTGNRYPDAGIVMALLMGKAAVGFPQPVLAQIVAARAMTKPMAIRVATVEVANFVAMLCALFFFGAGAVGVAATSLVTTLLLYPPLIWTFGQKLMSVSFAQWCRQTVVPGVRPALFSAPIWLGCRLGFSPESWLELALQGAVVAAGYFGMLVFFCLQPSEREDLTKVLAKLRAVLPGGR